MAHPQHDTESICSSAVKTDKLELTSHPAISSHEISIMKNSTQEQISNSYIRIHLFSNEEGQDRFFITVLAKNNSKVGHFKIHYFDSSALSGVLAVFLLCNRQ